jgi:hypothetical protein
MCDVEVVVVALDAGVNRCVPLVRPRTGDGPFMTLV